MIKIKYGSNELNSNLLDIDLYKRFSMDESDISILTIYNPFKGLTEALKRDDKDVTIEIDDNVISSGDIIKNIPSSNDTSIYLLVVLTDSLKKIHENVLTQVFSNTNYSKVLESACKLAGISIGKIAIENDIKFKNYTLYGTLNEILKEIKENTGVSTFIRNGMVYAVNGSIDTFEVNKNFVTTIKKIDLNKSEIMFKKMITQLNQGVKLLIEDNKYLIIKGEHKYSSSDNENYTLVEVVTID